MIPVVVGAALAGPVTPEDVVAAALRSDPRCAEAAADVAAARGERRAVSTLLSNPEVQVGASALGDLTWVQAQQPLSLSGEGWYARAAAREAVAAAEAREERVRYVVAADARWRWAEAAAAAVRADGATEAAGLATRLREVAERRAGVGEGTVVELALARSSEAVALAAALAARAERTRTELSLAALGIAEPAVEGRPSAAVPTRGAPGPGARADLRAATHRVSQARAEERRARAASVPAVGVGVQAQSDGGARDVGPMLTVALPLWDRGGAAVGAASGDVGVAEAAERSLREQAAAELAVTAADAAWARERLPRTEGLDESVHEALVAVAAAADAGELGIRDAALLQRELLDGRAAALEVELAVVRAELDAMVAAEDGALLP